MLLATVGKCLASAVPNERLVPISLRLEADLLDQIDAYCRANGEARSSFIRRAAVQAMEGPVVVGNTHQGPAVDQDAREALQALLARVQELEDQVSQLQTISSPKAKNTFSELFKP